MFKEEVKPQDMSIVNFNISNLTTLISSYVIFESCYDFVMPAKSLEKK